MLVAGCQENESCSKVLNFLEEFDDRIRCTHEDYFHSLFLLEEYFCFSSRLII